jgi:hypothetical protein
MNEKSRLLQAADDAFTELQQATGGLTEDEMVEVWFGTWGVREILIHISGWHRAMIPALQRVGRGEPLYPPGTYDDFDVRAELEASHRDFMRAATAVPEHHFDAARELLDGAGTAHYREHTGQIRGWRER